MLRSHIARPPDALAAWGGGGITGSKTVGDNRRPEYEHEKEYQLYGHCGDADAR